jgi:hypothetical protein
MIPLAQKFVTPFPCKVGKSKQIFVPFLQRHRSAHSREEQKGFIVLLLAFASSFMLRFSHVVIMHIAETLQ